MVMTFNSLKHLIATTYLGVDLEVTEAGEHLGSIEFKLPDSSEYKVTLTLYNEGKYLNIYIDDILPYVNIRSSPNKQEVMEYLLESQTACKIGMWGLDRHGELYLNWRIYIQDAPGITKEQFLDTMENLIGTINDERSAIVYVLNQKV